MKRTCNFQRNPAFVLGMALLWSGVFARNVLELLGILSILPVLLWGGGGALSFVGLLYGSAKTRPLFDRFCAFKTRLLGR